MRFDWTWEGSLAYQLHDPDDPTDRTWSGEVVQVDEDRGQIYVARGSGEVVEGPLWVRPFGFLDALQTLFLQAIERPRVASSLEAALAATLGQPQPPGSRAPAAAKGGTDHRANRASRRRAAPEGSEGWSILWGPPGTGKTWTIGRRVAQAEADERVLVASTTNRATDAVALQIADALRERGASLDGVRRIGAGADLRRFESRGAESLVVGSAAEARRRLARLLAMRRRAADPEARARLTVQINEARREIRDTVGVFVDPQARVVVCTAFHAVSQVVGPLVGPLLAAGRAPFTTVILDEAGLSSRAATAAIAQLAARRVQLVGDPQQLAPISRVARVLPSTEARWLAASGLSHLDPAQPVPDQVELLTVQHRMGPAIRQVVSEYAYHGRLSDAPTVLERTFVADGALLAQPRALWYVLDEDTGGRFADIRAERGPGQRSWIRRRTFAVLDELLRAHPSLAQHRTLVMTPFRAQAQAVARQLAERGLANWEACTVHAQQGAEAPVVLFDPVNAGSTAWGADEWRRLVNVAVSRAQHQLVVIASRLEMQEPYLRTLAEQLPPRVLERRGTSWAWREVSGLAPARPRPARDRRGPRLGDQIARRRAMRPVLSREQERLCRLKLDGGPRLVRGVAGSGKTWVLAYWVARTVRASSFEGRALVIYANRALHGMLDDLIARAWSELEPTAERGPLPRGRFRLVHVRDLLDELLDEEGLPPVEGYDFDAAALRYQAAVPDFSHRPRCTVMFVDEAQDVGPETLRLLAGLVRPRTPRALHRPIHVFYDNAQNLYGRGTPRWSELGIPVRGRSTVLETSYRNTRPIAELALNVLDRLVDLRRDPDHRELVRRGLVEVSDREGEGLRVWFNEVDGPPPRFERFDERRTELRALGDRIVEWVDHEGVMPGDIRILANSSEVRQAVVAALTKSLRPLGVVVEGQARQTLSTSPRTIVVTTAHSFKGHEAEIVAVPGVERFVARSAEPPRILARALYVALTRARSVLYVSGSSVPDPTSRAGAMSERVLQTVAESAERAGHRESDFA